MGNIFPHCSNQFMTQCSEYNPGIIRHDKNETLATTMNGCAAKLIDSQLWLLSNIDKLTLYRETKYLIMKLWIQFFTHLKISYAGAV